MTFISYIFRKLSIFIILLLPTLYACSKGLEKESVFDDFQSIPHLKDIIIDGDPSDWPDSYPPIRLLSDIQGESPAPGDLKAYFRLAWSENGLLILAEVEDDVIFEDPKKFWNGDGIEIFLSPGIGSFDIIQMSLRPSFDLKDSLVFMNIFDHRRSDSLKTISPESMFFGSKSSSAYCLEGLIPLDMLGLSAAAETMEMAIQLYINDADFSGDTSNFSLPWFPVRDSYRNPYAFQKIRFSQSQVPSRPCEVRAIIKDDQSLQIKLLSEEPYSNRDMSIQAGNLNRRFSLNQENPDLFVYEWNLPFRKLASEKDVLRFFQHDSLFFEINLCLLHRVYEDISEPNRFEKEIRIFEILDHFNPPPPKSLIITGSSTIRRWNNLNSDLPGFDFINRGFGGSTMEDLNYYADRIVFPNDPSGVFIYEGDNDIARGTSPSQFIEGCVEFIDACRDRIPSAELYFLSIKPSPSRIKNWEDMQTANRLLEELTERYENVHYIDISVGLLNEYGEPIEDLFVEDRLHLNEKGYKILSETLKSNIN